MVWIVYKQKVYNRNIELICERSDKSFLWEPILTIGNCCKGLTGFDKKKRFIKLFKPQV